MALPTGGGESDWSAMGLLRWTLRNMLLLQSFDGVTGHSSPDPIAARQLSTIDNTQPIVRVLLILSLVFASISVLSTLSALYWFVKMRRSFRHELILLLIQSDFLKSMVFFVFPIVSFALGGVSSDSTFCQVSGFALAVGIESSDIAVLLIALHSVMYIFRPRSGLYPYRQFACMAFYVYPVLAASLAFINGNGYENMGHYCYLRKDRGWARLALSWVPRYFISASIVIIYIFIYLYIRRRMGDYGRRRSEAMHQPQPEQPSNSGQTAPRLCYHGLVPSRSSSRRTSASGAVCDAKERQRPASSVVSLRLGSPRLSADSAASGVPVRWNRIGFTEGPMTEAADPRLADTDDTSSPVSPSLLSPPAAYSRRPSQVSTIIDEQTELSAVKTRVSFQDSRSPAKRPSYGSNVSQQTKPNRSPSSSSSATAVSYHDDHHHHTTHQEETDTSPILPIPTIIRTARATPLLTTPPNTSPLPPTTTTIHHDHFPPPAPARQPQHQLRALFVYPLAYICVWLFPFISHVLGYDDDVSQQQQSDNDNDRAAPHWLLIVSIISLCAQGSVDCTLFLLRERPWRHAGGRSFLVAVRRRWAWGWGKCWAWWSGGRGSRGIGGGGGAVGRTREEMLVDGRIARERRAGEVRVERARARGARTGRGEEGMGRGREWWEGWEEGGEMEDYDDHGWDDGDWEEEDGHGLRGR